MEFHLMESPDWVNVVATTLNDQGQDCFVLVRQFRPGAGKLSLEFPGGLMDPGEDPPTAAARELREETGYSPGSIRVIGKTNPNPAFMTNTMYTFFAQDLTLSHDLDLDDDEYLEPVLVPIDDILAGKVEEFLVNGIMLIALGWYKLEFGK
jgi:8-oxo-dGTP pyrophosphatase MutT (NUDIX family)